MYRILHTYSALILQIADVNNDSHEDLVISASLRTEDLLDDFEKGWWCSQYCIYTLIYRTRRNSDNYK